MRIAVCDDDRQDRERVRRALREAVPEAEAVCFPDGASLLEAMNGRSTFDIVFLDIYMPGEDGIKTAGAILKGRADTGIVFVTESRDHAVDAFSLRALHYIVKPVTAADVAEALRRYGDLRPEPKTAIEVTVGRTIKRVFTEDICTLTSANHAVEITLADGEQIKVWSSLAELEHRLGRGFLKINRGVIVNMDYIEEMRPDRCVMQNGRELYRAVRERGAVSAAYQDYLMDCVSRRRKEP